MTDLDELVLNQSPFGHALARSYIVPRISDSAQNDRIVRVPLLLTEFVRTSVRELNLVESR